MSFAAFLAQIGEKTEKDTSSVKVRFQDSTLTLSYNLFNGPESNWVQCFQVTEVKSIPSGYFGFTASTGDLTDEHSIFSFKVGRDDERRRETARDEERRRETKRDEER